MLRRAFAIGFLLAGTVVSVEAQWLNHRDPKTPRTADGKPNLAAPAPRSKGKPDLSGVWQTELETVEMIASRSKDENANKLIVPGDDPRTFSRYFFDVLSDFTDADAPMRQQTREYMRKTGERKAGNPSVRRPALAPPRWPTPPRRQTRG